MELSAAELREKLARGQAGDVQARNEVVEANLRLVWSIVQRFSHRGYDQNDLFQIGCIGLLKAVDRFDLSYDVKFSTYAVPLMLGEIQRYIRDDGAVRVSRGLKELNHRIRKEQERMSQELGRLPSVQELSQLLEVPSEQIVLAMDAAKPIHSMNEPIHESDGEALTIQDMLSEEQKIDWQERMALQDLVRRLPPRERKIIMLRYFSEQTQTQVAQALGISQVQVSRLEKKLIEQIREKWCGKEKVSTT